MSSGIDDDLNSETTQVLWRRSFSFSWKIPLNSLKFMKMRPKLNWQIFLNTSQIKKFEKVINSEKVYYWIRIFLSFKLFSYLLDLKLLSCITKSNQNGNKILIGQSSLNAGSHWRSSHHCQKQSSGNVSIK